MEYLDDYFPSSPLPSYSSSMRDLPPVPSFRIRRPHHPRRRSSPGESSNIHVHAAHLKNEEHSNWATLKVESKSSKTPVQIIQSQSIKGTLEINLTKSKSIESISVEIHGELVIMGEATRFLFMEELLWRNSSISGRHSWSFNFNLPSRVSIPKIEMPLLYLPSSRAQAPSSQRQLAYRDTQVPPGPIADPEGWYSLGRFTQKGYIFGVRIVNIVFNCFLANPLSYAKGTIIPFIIVASSDDEQALDLISSRKALAISLTRSLQLNIGSRNGPRTTTTVGTASYCSPSSNVPPTGWRTIEGEIHVPSYETPSFQTSLLTCSHTVVIQLMALGFTPFLRDSARDSDDTTDGTLTLFSQNVSITTYPSSGPRPRFRTEAVYPEFKDQDCEALFFMKNNAFLFP
ncbi:hypothetical protein Clacol_005981 [Clathrus columnatus]|uniref:Arrestin-like N-terminal domain-containing protein n=1 Tax=Clathrus columnatus TaxID=1419009 RepID=A0AAV5AGD6_9AGAM|nr:hypothetical protein Clacol_005981 [Clathrus columnatus]